MSTEAARSHLRIVRGDPTPEEIAALVAVLTAAASASPADVEEPPHAQHAVRSQWGAPARVMRSAISPSGWWVSGLPR